MFSNSQDIKFLLSNLPPASLPANIENQPENKRKFNKKTLEQMDSQQPRPSHFSVINHHCNKGQVEAA